MNSLLRLISGLSLLMLVGLSPAADENQTGSDSAPGTLRDELQEGLYSRINVLGFGTYLDLERSRLNPRNILTIPRYQAEIDIRPDFNLEFRRWEFILKPRVALTGRRWEDGVRDNHTDLSARFFLNEGSVRYRVTDQWITSYGRENLQWGPSSLVSPSNPFNRENARNNPRLEVPGLEYARLIWIPNSTWSASFIANTGEGHLRVSGFEKGYALKLDYVHNGAYFTLIPSYREDGRWQLGFFGGWNATDAVILYTEGFVADRTDNYELLTGGSYTFESGTMLTLEYYRNNNGCVISRFELCFGPTAATPLATAPSGLDPTDPLIRRDYLMFQFTDMDFLDPNIDFTTRVIHNLNDDSSRLIGLMEYALNDHSQLFLIGDAFTSHNSTEFGSLLDYSLFGGVGFTF